MLFYLSLLVYIRYGTPNRPLFCFSAVLLVVITDQITNAFKYGFERLRLAIQRDKRKDALGKKGCGGGIVFFRACLKLLCFGHFFGFIFQNTNVPSSYVG